MNATWIIACSSLDPGEYHQTLAHLSGRAMYFMLMPLMSGRCCRPWQLLPDSSACRGR